MFSENIRIILQIHPLKRQKQIICASFKAKIPPRSDKTAPTAAFTLVSVAAATTPVASLRLCLSLYI